VFVFQCELQIAVNQPVGMMESVFWAPKFVFFLFDPPCFVFYLGDIRKYFGFN